MNLKNKSFTRVGVYLPGHSSPLFMTGESRKKHILIRDRFKIQLTLALLFCISD